MAEPDWKAKPQKEKWCPIQQIPLGKRNNYDVGHYDTQRKAGVWVEELTQPAACPP